MSIDYVAVHSLILRPRMRYHYKWQARNVHLYDRVLQTQDPTEHKDLNSANDARVAQLVERMVDRIRAINATAFSPHRGMPSPLGCQVAVEK